jgi:F0F1-type ATP synthase assembly protein I
MAWLVTKWAVTAALVVALSEVAKRYERLGGLLAALPTMTILAMVWMWADGTPSEKVAAHARYTFWYVVPTLPMFLAFPALQERFGFWGALGLSVVLTMALFWAFARVVRPFGIQLL